MPIFSFRDVKLVISIHCLILFAYPFILADCYDGSDGYDSNISYPNTCLQNGNNMTRTFSSEVIARDKEDKVTLEELVERLREL
ncbi:hypothetical protein GIB67_030707 [Kingdonia uniflora]|uniref:Uncharacterized protein n=1 Tax=Kingdonia uniflora TaxID=39325 RepID=A0A7J7LPL7_9MAGN|nr:hypothetical protein GIB67_030707 [Kingdonia uniflora]